MTQHCAQFVPPSGDGLYKWVQCCVRRAFFVAMRWVRLVPPREGTEAAFDAKRQHPCAGPERLRPLRGWLSDLSL